MPPRTVLIAVNGSEHSKRAFNWYLEKNRMIGDQVLFAHVVDCSTFIPPPTYAHGPVPSRDEWDKMMDELMAKARLVTKPLEDGFEEYVSQNEGHDNESKEAQYQTICSVGNAGEAICKMAEDNVVDMVIIGNRGLGTIRRTLLGSVSDYIIQHCRVPVVVVPPTDN